MGVVKDVTKFYKPHLLWGGGGNSKVCVDGEGCITPNNLGIWGLAPPDFFYINRCSEIDCEAFWEY